MECYRRERLNPTASPEPGREAMTSRENRPGGPVVLPPPLAYGTNVAVASKRAVRNEWNSPS